MGRVFAVLFAVFLAILISGCTSSPKLQAKTVEEIMAERPIGQNVTVIGVASLFNLVCTQIDCPEEQPCCNLCSGGLALAGEREQLPLFADGTGCAGSDCQQACRPLALGGNYTVSGLLQEREGRLILLMTGFEER